jgi:hypothetical protein
MYCQRCYQDLQGAPDQRCSRCGFGFDPQDPKTFLDRPFPPPRTVVFYVVLTTILGVVVAFIVAFHQAVQASGH